MKNLIILLSVIILFASCGNIKENQQNPETSVTKSILVDDFSDYERESSETQILDAVITDSTLTLNVSYSGGCKNHNFELIGSKNIQKSYPAIRGIMLVHHSNNDDCRELIEEEIKFDISNFKYPNGDIMLNLSGYKSKILFKSID